MKALSSAVAAAAVLFASASAQVIANPSGVVKNFDIANLGPVLTELGVSWEQRSGPNGQPFIAADFGGYMVNIVPSACQGQNFTQCLGVQTFSINEEQGVTQQAINAFNLSYAFLSAGPVTNGYYLSRYDIADYGIARGNVQSSLSSFFQIALGASEALMGGQTVSTIGYAEDMSAAGLNEASARSIGVDASVKSGDPITDMHVREIRATAELIKAFAASPEAARNKIDNLTKK